MDHRWNSDPDLGHAEFRIVRSNAEIASSGNFEAAAETPSGHPRDHGTGKRPHRLAEIAQAGYELLSRSLVESGHLLDVGTPDHALFALAANDQRANLPVSRKHLETFANALDNSRPKDIERAGV